MDRIQIRGGGALNGVIPISGAKNAALPLMIASLMTDQTLTLENLPRLADVAQLAHILGNHGVDYSVDGKRIGEEAGSGQTAHLRARTIVDTTAPYEMVAKMRASFWVIAPLIARMGSARVSLPGGCAIGTRPVDLLLMALEKLGARDRDRRRLCGRQGPEGPRWGGDRVSQGDGWGNACGDDGGVDRARGDADPQRGARAGGRRSRRLPQQDGRAHPGAGTPTIEIEGVVRLNGAHHRVLPDRIEAGTYATAVAMTGGEVLLEGVGEDLLEEVLDALEEAGATVTSDNRGVRVQRNGAGLSAVDVTTAPFPGFPTDLQAQFMALMTRARGVSRIKETIFENRFMHVQELARLGARIKLEGDTAIVSGVERLCGAPVMATDLRASVSLVIAGSRGGGGNDRQSRLPSRSRLRTAGREARRLRGRHCAPRELGRWRLKGKR